MPTVIVRMYEGRTDEQKSNVESGIVDVVAAALEVGPESVSVEFDEISRES